MIKKTMNLGGSIVSKNIVENRGRIKWCFREQSVNAIDNGWKFISDIDTDEFLKDSNNMLVCDWGTIFEIEPAIEPIFNMPIGTELILEYEGNKKYFINSDTGEVCKF